MIPPPPCSTFFPYTTLFRSLPSSTLRSGRISVGSGFQIVRTTRSAPLVMPPSRPPARSVRSEEHTSELQSLRHLVCRLLLEKKKKKHADEKNESLYN